MFVATNFITAFAYILEIILQILFCIIVARAVISWVNPDPFNPIVQFLNKATEPILSQIRKILPFAFKTGIDLSPVIACLLIQFLKYFLIRSLYDLARILGNGMIAAMIIYYTKHELDKNVNRYLSVQWSHGLKFVAPS